MTEPRVEGGPVADATLARKVGRGGAWIGLGVILTRLGNIVVMAAVARLVTPEEYGTFIIAATVFGVVVSTAELGLSSAIARADLDLDRIAPTVTTVALVSSGVLAAGLWWGADAIAAVMGAPDAADATRVLALCLLLSGIFAVPGAQLQRDFRQQVVVAGTVASFVVSSVLLLVLARSGDGAMAFAWSRVVGQVVMGLVMVAGLTRFYWPGFDRSQLGPLLAFGLPLTGTNLLSQLVLNIDFLLVGRALGATSLGLYALAFNVANWPRSLLSSMINGVAVPAFSRVRADGGDLSGAVRVAVSAVTLVAAPVACLTVALAEPLVTVVYGRRWTAAVPVLKVLSLYGVAFVVCLLLAGLVIAIGRTAALLGVQVAALVALVPAIVLGVDRLGAVGAGVAHIVVILAVTLPAYLFALHRAAGVLPRVVLAAMARPLAAAVAAGLVAAGVAALLDTPPAELFVGGLAGGATYLVLAWRPLVAASPWPLPDLPSWFARRVRRAG